MRIRGIGRPAVEPEGATCLSQGAAWQVLVRGLGIALGLMLVLAPAAQSQSLRNLLGDGKPLVDPKPLTSLAPLSQGSLIPLDLGPLAAHRYAIDAESIAVEAERLVRYSLVITSSSGARNISHEVIGCDRGQWMMLALGRADGGWTMLGEPTWRALDFGDTTVRARREIFARLCEGGAAIDQNPRRIAERLRRAPAQQPNP